MARLRSRGDVGAGSLAGRRGTLGRSRVHRGSICRCTSRPALDDLPLWPVFFTLMGYAVLLAWIYDGSGRSSLLAGITHAALNGFVPLTAGLDKAWVWEAPRMVFALVGVAVLGLIALRPTAARADVPEANPSVVGDRGR